MAQVTLDDSIEKLQSFCNVLGETSAILARDAEVLEGRAYNLERAHAETRERTERVSHRLEAALGELTAAQAEAALETERLSEAAQGLAPARLSEALTDVERGETAFEERLSHDRAELEKEFLDLAGAGFGALSSAVDAAEAELTTAGDDAGGALQSLEQDLSALGQRAIEVRTETVAALDGEEQALREERLAELEQRVLEHAALWTQELPETLEQECTAVAAPLETLYDGWEREVAAEGDELGDTVCALLQDATEAVANEAGRALAEQVDETTRESLEALTGELDGLLPVVTEGEPAAEAASALVDDLVVSRRAIGEIDKMLNAIQG